MHSWKKVLLRLFPFAAWLPELKSPQTLRGDIVAGTTIALILVPQSMAYAQLAGLPPYYGLYAAFLPPIVAAFFGSSRQLATGPTAIASLMTVAAVAPLATTGTGAYIAYCVILSVMVGVFRLAFGFLRMGAVMNFLSRPVVQGFTNAAALIIATSQLAPLFGVSAAKSPYHFVAVYRTLASVVKGLDLTTIGLAAIALGTIVLTNRLRLRSPSILIAVVVTTVVSWLAGYRGAVVGQIPLGLPAFGLPLRDVPGVWQLLPSALAISIMGLTEATAIARTIAIRTRQKLNLNQEFIGQGLANVVGGLSQSLPVSGSFSRSAVALATNGKTGFTSLVSSALVLLVLLFLAPLLGPLPKATLAIVVVYAVARLIKVKPIVRAWRTSPYEGIAAVLTFVVTLGFAPHVEYGVFFGVLLSIIFRLRQTLRPRVAILSRHPDGSLRDGKTHGLGTCPTISVIRIEGSMYFANADYLAEKVLEHIEIKPQLRHVVIDAEGINMIDATGAERIEELVNHLSDSKIELWLSRVKHPLRETLQCSGLLNMIGEEHIFGRTEHALQAIWAKDPCSCDMDCPYVLSTPEENGGPTRVD